MKGKIAVMSEPGKLGYQEFDVPAPGPGAVVVKVLCSNVCGSELHIWKGEHPKKSGGLGHETVGVIDQLGEGVTTDNAGVPLAVGDRIAATYFIACQRCPACQSGKLNLCENAYSFWARSPQEAPHFHTTFSTHYFIHPGQFFYKVPDNVPDKLAAGANCALSQVFYGLDLAEVKMQDHVVVQGAGGLGIYATAIAHRKGATVTVIDADEGRLALAREFGADNVINFKDYPSKESRIERLKELTGGNGADVCLEVAGVPEAFVEGIELVRSGGKLVTMGNVTPGKTIAVDPGFITRQQVTIIPVMRYQPRYLWHSLKFLSDNMTTLPFEKLLDTEYSLECVENALADSLARKVTRASIVMSGEG
ncbi:MULTISPECIES: zinc-binding dehydrogenase [Cobetia]|uniref:Zinc-binding dehydrogenase n=1 Tax=Cobetia amphilecti TaxID=1055104 RepID=A0AAP4TWP6_9GAMM|nr:MULTISPECIES: zinc-binding dehydrogenase [Cobetia]AVV32317.1 zinc-binding alcohol dehydrogenase [Halomonas sp. SF2003]MCK8066969.1 zinc-binding dehydrogenase [Cobetia sp. 1CM21F]MDH2421850.1 zinc-binding dehydrogenase [Cobetia litoralis]MDO6670887.1 zinc-binding dehydrogenase [Cobetia amphilecti]UTV86763.1 zinc-binding dehydrogenase [Cobetia litoralis]